MVVIVVRLVNGLYLDASRNEEYSHAAHTLDQSYCDAISKHVRPGAGIVSTGTQLSSDRFCIQMGRVFLWNMLMDERVFSAVQESVTLTHALLWQIVLGAVL